MNCRQMESLLFDHLEGALKARDQGAVLAHLRDCPACRRRRDEVIALEEKISEAIHWQPEPFPGFRRRAMDRWLAAREAPAAARRRSSPSLPPIPALRLSLLGAAAVAVVAALLSLAGRQHQRPSRLSPPQVVRREQPIHSLLPPPAVQQPAAPSPTLRTVPPGPARQSSPEWNAPHARFQGAPKVGRQAPAFRSPRPAVDDLMAINADPEAHLRQWMSVPKSQWERIEARVHRYVRVRDDFITLPFPRLASVSDRQLAAAVTSYKREAAIVDPRLAREVDLQFKGTALADVCSQLRSDTGIELSAGPSVADEKVTVFCEKLPLRDVMRQLSRPFGYTWLRSKKEGGEYRYELVQDLRSQLLEEELRNRDRDGALLALDREIDRYRPYLGLSPDEARTRTATAAPEEKKLLENYSGWGWGPLQLYARLSPQQQAELRAGETISFSGDPHRVAQDGAQPLPPDLERGVLQSMRDVRVRRPGGQTAPGDQPGIGSAQNLPDGIPPAASPEANGFVVLRIAHSELGQFTFDGGSGVTVGNYITVRGHDGDLGRGVSPAVQDPKNEIANARLAHDPTLTQRIAVAPVASCPPPAAHPEPAPGSQAAPEKKVTTADVLEALHRASGLPIVADFYTHLYPQASVSVHGQSLFEALNHLADAMHLRWNKDGGWLQFRSVSYYDDRVKEVPNRLLARWAGARRQHDGLPLDDLIEMAQLTDAQLDSRFVGEGVKECWGLEEWSLAQNREGRPHLRYLAQLTPAQRQMAMSAQGLPFTQLSLAQQQGLIAHLGERLHSLDELAGATVRGEYSEPGGFRWPAVNWQPPSGQPNLFGLAQVHEPTRAAALAAARQLDAGVLEAQITPTDLSLTIVYTLIDPKTGKARELGVRAHADGALISW